MIKLERLEAFCRQKVKNINNDQTEMTTAERRAIKKNEHPSDTLKQMAGSGMDIDLLFTALASAVGFDARLARIPDRGLHFFTPEVPIQYFLRNNYSVAVKVADHWIFYDPASHLLAPGGLRWQEEGQQALVSDPKGGFL